MPVSVATMNLQAYQSLDARARRAIDQAAAQTESEQWKRIDGTGCGRTTPTCARTA
ncbi:hypothetical protein WJ968_16025 [Achromobacter xylosoxidans]